LPTQFDIKIVISFTILGRLMDLKRQLGWRVEV